MSAKWQYFVITVLCLLLPANVCARTDATAQREAAAGTKSTCRVITLEIEEALSKVCARLKRGQGDCRELMKQDSDGVKKSFGDDYALADFDSKIIPNKIYDFGSIIVRYRDEAYLNFFEVRKNRDGVWEIETINLPAAPLSTTPQDSASIYFRRGIAARNRGNCERAIADFTRAIMLAPANAAAFRERGVCRSQTGATEMAFADFAAALRLEPDNAEVLIERAMLFKAQQNHISVIADLTTVIEGGSRRTKNQLERALVERAVAFQAIYEYEKALADASSAVRQNSRGYDALTTRADVYAEIGKFAESLADYTRAIQLQPRQPWAYLKRATVYQQLGKSALASRDERSAKRFFETRSVTVEMPIYTGDVRDETIETPEIYKPGNTSVLIPIGDDNRINQKALKQQAEEEISRLTRILRVNPNFAAAWLERGDNQRVAGKYAEAVADLTEAIRLAPHNAEAYRLRAKALRRLGKTAEAVADEEKAVRLAPKNQ